MGAPGEPAQHVFGPDDGEREGFGRAVDGRKEQHAAGFQQRAERLEEKRHVGDVLDHFQRQHHVELLTGFGQRLGRGVAVIDGDAGFGGMQAGYLDVALGGVDADDFGPEPSQRFGQQAAAAADIDDAEALQGQHARRVAAEAGTDRVADIADANRVVLVQRLELAARVPPFRRDGAEAGDLPGIHRAAAGSGFSGGGGGKSRWGRYWWQTWVCSWMRLDAGCDR